MIRESFYELPLPTEWVPAPVHWGVTALDDVSTCPRRWQLLRSVWGEFLTFPVRPHPAADEGNIVHEALDLLFRACARAGRPVIGTPEFSDVIADINFFRFFEDATAACRARTISHPRPRPTGPRATPEELANRAIRLFREQYLPASELRPSKTTGIEAQARATSMPIAGSSGAGSYRPDGPERAGLLRAGLTLSELWLEHPDLPLVGKLDLVGMRGGLMVVTDHKTGARRAQHRQQVLRYAVLLWRSLGVRPDAIAVQYLDGREQWPVSEAELSLEQSAIAETLTVLSQALGPRLAPAQKGEQCRLCAVRARCDDGWATTKPPKEGTGDVEVTVMSAPGPNGFGGRVGSAEVPVVYEIAVGAGLPAVGVGDRLRLLDAVVRAGAVEIKVWTEPFVIRAGAANDAPATVRKKR